MKPSEFGGSDTHKTLGIQPSPHKLTPEEKLRVMYHEEPATLEPAAPEALELEGLV